MSAQLAEQGAALGASNRLTNSFHASLVLAAGVTAHINAPTLSDLSAVVAKLQPTEAVNDPGKSTKPAPTPAAATAPAGASASPTTASSAPAAAAAAAQGDAGNGAAAPQAATSAPAASSEKPAASSEVSFDALKKAFLALSQKANGRALCEGVLGAVEPKLGKLSEAKPEQYATLLAAIQKASE